MEYVEEEDLLICIVSDGVGSRPADFLASGIACEEFGTAFIKHKELAFEVRITLTVKEINWKLLEIEEYNKGLMSKHVIN